MKIIITENYEASCKWVAEKLIETVNTTENPKLGLATGSTAEFIYPLLIEAGKAGRVDFSKTSTVNLDEYLGMDPENDQSYRKSMNRWLFDHINIDKSKTFVANGKNDPAAEIKLFNEKLYGDKLVDVQLLGVGVSGHIGFNEPREALTAGVHIEDLDESTIAANARFFEDAADVPRQAITMGVGDILKAREVVLIATGASKVPAMKALLMNDTVSGACPVTVLKLHPAATIVIDKALAAEIGYQA